MKKLIAAVTSAALTGSVIVGSFTLPVVASEIQKAEDKEQAMCLAKNIYFEARNQSVAGQVAVAWVTMNRVNAKHYPSSICGVVWQNKQFSWTHDGLPDRPGRNVLEQRAWEDAGLIADVVLLDWAHGHISPVEHATHYHADYVKPYWASSYTRVAVVDNHIFYQP